MPAHMNPAEFGKAINSQAGLPVRGSLEGFARKTTDPRIIEFSPLPVLVQRELEVCLLSVSVISGTTMLSYHVVALTGWPSSAA